MTRVVRSTEARGSISLRIRLDLTTIEPDHREAALGELADSLDTGSTIELIVAPVDDHELAAAYLSELIDGGVHIALCGTPNELQDWLTSQLQTKAASG